LSTFVAAATAEQHLSLSLAASHQPPFFRRVCFRMFIAHVPRGNKSDGLYPVSAFCLMYIYVCRYVSALSSSLSPSSPLVIRDLTGIIQPKKKKKK
jgi:hypothetical protein